MNKYQRYRLKNTAQGRCPHCGKSCAPYYECEDRRLNKKVYRTLNRMVLSGELTQEGDLYKKEKHEPWIKIRCLSYNTKLEDRRNLPRIGKQYVDLETICVEILREAGKPLAAAEIDKRFMAILAKMKQKLKKED